MRRSRDAEPVEAGLLSPIKPISRPSPRYPAERRPLCRKPSALIPAALNNLVPFSEKNPNKGLHLGQEGFYSFIFDGNSQMLDHFFVTSSLLPSAKFDVVHLNVDFPRTFINTTASDHEPMLTSFSLD